MSYKVKEQIQTLEVEVDRYQPFYYAGASGDFNPIHIDNDFAKAASLGGIILQGLCTMAYVYRAAVRDGDPTKVKKLKVRFKQVVKPLDNLVIKGEVVGIENDLVTIDLLAENQKGEQVITNAYAIVEN